MDAWETLISGSTIASGDTWEHLQAQGCGSGSIEYLVLTDGLGVEMATTEINVEIDGGLEVEIDQAGIEAEIDQSPREAEI